MYLKNKFYQWGIILALSGFTLGCSSGFLGIAPVGDRKEYAQARKLYEQKAYTAAITELKDYIYKTKNVNRREVRAYRLLGLSYEKTGQLGRALETYLEALEFHPDNVPLLLEAARLYQQTNLTDRSIALYEKVLQEEPDNLEALSGQAANYTAMGFYSKARQFYDRFFELNPTAASQYRARYASTFLAQRNYQQAFINITMALAETEDNPDFWLISAQARRGLNQKEQSLQDLQAALELAPNRMDLLGNQALWLYEAGKYDAAQKTSQQMQTINPDSQLALLVQSLIAQKRGKTAQARRLCQRIVQLDANSFIGQVAAKNLQ